MAVALAMNFAEQGKKTLLVELGDESFYQDYLALPRVGYQPQKYRSRLDVSLWSGPACLREYALYLLKVERLYKLFFENPISKTLIDVAPALAELAILGKVTSGPPRNVGPKLPYDCLVVDAYATGHFLALLRAPIGMAEAIRFGPMGEQSRSILKVLKDPRISHYHIVCLPEELPVQESIELEGDLRKIVGVPLTLWLNKWVDYPEKLHAHGPAYEQEFFHKRKRQNEAWTELKAKFDGRIRKIPFFFETREEKLVPLLAESVR